MEEKDTLGLLAQQKLDEANNNQTLHNLEQNILAKKQIDEAKSLNKNSQGLRYWDRLSAEGTFLKGQEYQTQSNMINKQYADKNAYDTYQRDKNYDPSTLLQTGFAAPNLTLTEQQALSVSKKLNYQDTLANEVERRKQLEGQLQQNQNNFDRLQALMGVEKEKFYNNLNSIDREYERNIEAVRVANLPYQNILEQTNKYMSSNDGRYNTSYWAALQDGATGLLDSFTDLGRGTFHFLLNGSFDDYEPTEWFKRNFGGHYSSQYEAPLSDESWFNKANLKNFIGMGIQSIPEMIGLVASVAISRGLTAPLLAKRIEQLTTLSSKLRTAGKIEQATFVSTLAKILPKVATTATAVGAIEGPRRTLQIAKDRQDVYGGKFSVDSGDYLAGSASAALDLAGMAFWTKGIGTHWNKIASKMAVTPEGDIISNVTSNLPKLAGGVVTNIAPSVIAEGGTEFIQTALEMSRIHNIDLTDFIDIMSSDNAKYNGIKHQLLDAAAVGGLMGGAFSFIGQGVKGVQDFKNYQQEKKQLENQKGNAENYFATTAATTTAGVEHMRTFMSSTINNLFKDTPNINETDLKTFKDKTDKLNHTITDKIIQKQKEAELNKESNPEAYQTNLEERTHLARAYDKMVMSMAMLAKDLPFKETNELVNNLNNIFTDSKLEPTKLEAEVTNTIANFIQSNPKVQDLFKQIIKDTMNQNAKDLSAFFEQFNIEVAKPKTTETTTVKEAPKANVSLEEQAIREKILKEADIEAKNVFDDSNAEQQKQTTKPKPNYIRRVKPKNKQDIKNLNFKNQLNLENTSPTIQEELGVELDIPKLEIKEKEAKQVLDNIINFLSSSPEGIKLLMEFQSKEKNIQEVVTQNIEGIALKSNEEVKEIFKEATDKDIEILKQMSSNINTSTPSNMTISLTEFKERISTLQKLQFKLMNLSLEQATNEYAAFRQQDIEVTTNMINEELDYFTNFFNRNLSDFLYVENLTEEQKDMILKRLYVTSKNLELINSNYAQILKISDADTRVPFDITTNNDEGVIQRIINYILKLVDRLSSLGRMFNASLSQFKFKNKQELELGLKTINTNFKALENNFTALSKELDNFKKVNSIIKENIESSALFLNADGKTKTFNINGTDLFLTKKSKFNLDKYALILSNLQLAKTTDVMSKLQSIKGKMNEVLEGKYKDTHLSTVSFNQLAKLLSFPNELDENGKIVKQDIDAQEALSLLSQASVIATLRAISKRENDKHNLDPDNYTLISSKSLDSDIIKGIESLLHIDINDKSLQMALSSLGFLLIKESPTNKTLNFNSTAFSEKVYRAIKKVQENPNNVANIINPKYFRFKASTKLPILTKQITNLITGEHSDPKKREKNILKALNVLQNAIELEVNYRKNPDNIKNTYFYYPITKVNAYSMILEQVKIEKNTANNLSEVFLPRTTPIQHKYASKVVNTRNMSQFSVNQSVKNILLEQLGVTLEDIEEVKHITKTNINAFKNEYIAQGNRVNNPNTYNPFFYFPIFNPKNPQEDIKYYRFKDFTKFKSFLSKVGLENSLNSSSAILENSDLSRSLASKIREDNKDIGELLTILLFPDNYHQDFYYEFNEQSQQRLQVKTGLFDIQRNKLLRPLIELKNWYHNGVYYNQQELKTYEQMDNNEKDSIVQALALIITNDSYDKPSQFNPETNILEYKFNEEFPTRESIRQALESEEGRAKLIPYLTRRAEELKLNDEPFIELNALLLKQWFENGFKEFNPNNLMIELDGRSTAVFEQAIHSNANPIASKLGLAKGYIETNPIQSMLLTNTKPRFKEKNSVDDVLNALENDYPYGNTIAKAIRAINKDNIEVAPTKPTTPTTNTSEVYSKTNFRDTQSPSGYVNHTGGAIGSDSYWNKIGEKYGVVSNNYIVENTRIGDTSLKPIYISEKTLKQFDEELKEINETSLARKFPSSPFADNLQRRNMIQVENADAIFAIGHIVSKGERNSKGFPVKITQVDGGTGWAVAKAKKDKKPIYLFDQERNRWYKSVYHSDGKFEMSSTDIPTLTPHFAGIGTRILKENGKKAIEDVYEKTFGKKSDLTDSFAKTRVSQARALTEIIKDLSPKSINASENIQNEEIETEPLTNFLTQNPYIDTFLALTDISLYTTKDYLTSSEASKMFKSLRDIAKKFLLPISYGSRIDAVIESTSTESVYHYLLELMGQQLSNVVSFYSPAKYKNFNLFLQGILNPKSNILPNIVKNENIRFHITKILENAVNNNLDEHNIGKAFDFYMENTNFITNFHTMGNRLNFEDLIKINNNQMINNQTIGQIKSSLDKITTLNKYSFSEIMDYLVSNGHLQVDNDKNIEIVDLPDKDNAQDKIVETIREYLKKGGFLYDLQYNPSMRNLVNYLLKNPNSYTETKFNNFYILELKQGFMYDALSDYTNSVQMRSNASALKQEIRNLVFKDIIEQELNKTNLSTITQDEYNQAIMNALDRIESYLDNTLVADKVDNTLNPTDSFQLARDSENVTPKDLLKNETALKTLISQITASYELPFNLETQVITNFTKRGDETTTERINATIHRLAYKSVINIIEHNLEAWVVGNILLETPVNMSIYDAGIVTMKNAKAFQDGWNKYFEEGPKAINLYSLPATLYKEGMNYNPRIIEESLRESNDKWNNIIKNTNFIYPVDFNNILQGGTEVNPYTNGDLKAYTIKDNPFNDFLNEFIQMNPNSNNFISSFPLYYRLTNEQKNSLKEEYGEDVINNAKHLDTNILMLPDDIVSTPHSKAIGSLYNKLNKNQITPVQFYNELKELYDNGLILPMSFGSKNNSASKNKFIRQAILSISKGFTPNFESNTNQDKSVLTDYKPLNPANNPLFVKKQLDYTKQETPVSITKEMLDNSERLHKQQTIDSIQNYINSLKGIENTVSRNIFNNIINNLPENIEFLHNPDITSKGMYVQDKNNHYIIIGNNSSPNTLLHEVIHASISNSMNRNTISAKNIISEMNNIMDYVRHKLENDTTLMEELNLLNEDGTTNAVYEEVFTNNDLSEFLAYFLTDKEKVEFLNNEKSKETLKGILPARVSIVGKGFHLLGRLVKGVIRLLSLNNWKNYNSQMTLDETLSNKLIELSNYNIDENYKKYKDKLYVKTLDTLNQAGSDLISLITKSTFSNIEEYAAKNNLSPEDIKKEITDFQNEFMNDILNPSARSSSKASYLKLLKPTNIMNPIKRRAIWELLGMLSQTKSSLMFRFISQIFVDFQLMSKNSTTAETLKRAEELSNRITYYMSQQQLGFDLTKSQINKLLETSLGDKYKELKEEERKFKQPTTEELRSDIYNRKQYSRLTQLERDLGGIIYNLKLSDALPFGFNKEISNNDILELLETTFLSNEVEKTNKVNSSLVETKSALFNLIGHLVDWKSVDDIPNELVTYIQNSTEILGYSRLSRQTSRAGFTNVEDIMRKLKDTKFNNIYIALSANIKPNETMSNKEYRIRRENYHNFFNSMRKLTTYQAIKALDKNTQSSEYHRLMIENIKNEFGLTNSISDNFNVLMTSLLTLHSSYNQRNKTINRYKPIDESKIIELQNEYALLNETNGDTERMNEIKEEINRLEAESYNRYNDFRDADFRETYYLDNRVPYAINSEISLKTILPNQDKAYYQYITNNKQINTQEEAINFLYELGYKFIDSNGKTQETYDSDNPNVTMRYDGYNKYEDTRVNIAYLGSSEMSAGNLLSESNLSEEEQNKIRGLATKQMQEELNSLFTNKWEFDEEVFEKSHIEYRPIGNSTKEFRTLTGRLAHNNMTEVDTRISELLANENKEITRNTTIDKVNVDLARALIKDNEIFNKNQLYKNEIKQGNYVKVFDINNPNNIDKEFYSKLSSEALSTFKEVLLSYNKNKSAADQITELYLNPLTTTFLFGFKNSKFSNAITNPKFRKYFNTLETTIENLFRENKTNVIIRNPRVVLANGLSNLMSLTGLGYPIDVILDSIEPLQQELRHYKKMQKELFEVENDIIQLQNLEDLNEEEQIELDKLRSKKERLENTMSQSRVHIPMQNGFDTNIIDETLQEPDNFDKIHLELQKYLPESFIKQGNTNILNELLMTSNSDYYQNLQNLNRLGDLIPKILAYEFSLEEGKTQEQALKFAQDYFVNYNIPITSPFLRMIERTGVGFYLKWGLKTQKIAIQTFLNKPASAMMSLAMSNVIAPSLLSPIVGESFLTKGLPLGQSLDISNYFRYGFLFK